MSNVQSSLNDLVHCAMAALLSAALTLPSLPLSASYAQDQPPPAPAEDPSASPTADPKAPSQPPAEAQPVELPTAVIEVIATPEPTEPPITLPRSNDPRVHFVQVGETLHSLAAQSGFSVGDLAQRNRLTSPYLLLAGQQIRLPAPPSNNIRLYRASAGDTLTSIAAQYGVSPYALRRVNDLPCSVCLVFGQTLRVPQAGAASNLPEPFERIEVAPIVPRQGEVVAVRVAARAPLQQITGMLADQPIRFAQKDGEYIALSGVAALQEPGIYPIVIRAITQDGLASVAQGRLQVGAGRFGYETLNLSAKLTPLLEPQVNQEERAELDAILSNFSGTQWWQGPLQWPIQSKIVSYYGTRRNFNRGMLNTFHSGIDLSARIGTPVKAAAPGRVAAAQTFPIRGNVIILDHGRGVFTVYCHLSKFEVEVNQIVNAGDVIGYTGNTGRSLGPHLHFELAVGGVTVNPLAWLERELP
ncbi:peptidoglycan DD-metalloendopeptidase family protein [Candidatus Roseilinea sp. NK_OTU-006]|uniref:peptidoglycan DD-metalloendopeptidase family protein n=1 Tax=Candidatus Roseilinea sp. NK_OTU-006 TaxID=2704250 RepID=UPI00145EB80F|nr:M23 family metallopeptidase [Candidatus Roseilinea sp. NK_OTU-006]